MWPFKRNLQVELARVDAKIKMLEQITNKATLAHSYYIDKWIEAEADRAEILLLMSST